MMPHFEAPLFLFFLLLLPFIIWFGWPSNGPSYRRECLSLLMRVIMVVCLVFSLAGMTLEKTSEDLAVVFLMDISDSLSQTSQKAEADFIRQSIQSMKANDRAAVVVFGRESAVDRNLSGLAEYAEITTRVDSDSTDLADAIRLGSTLFPAGVARRMVVLSDGYETSGDALAAARLAVESGIQIVAYTIENEPESEVLIKGLTVDEHLYEGQPYDLQISLQANRLTRSQLRVFVNDEAVFNKTITVQKGSQAMTLSLKADQSGFTRFFAQLDPQGDRLYQNNTYAAYTFIHGIPRVLVVDTPAGWIDPTSGQTRAQESTALVKALQGKDFSVELTDPGRMPTGLVDLSAYSAVVLVNLPASFFSRQQMLTLQNYVRYGGGGLVVVGGPNSLGAGGYAGTPLEQVLPVSMAIKPPAAEEPRSVVFVLDRSGSMAETSNGASKLDLAKEAIQHALGNLTEVDRVGVIAMDDPPYWVIPLTSNSNQENIIKTVNNLNSGGRTDMDNGINGAGEILADDPASDKQLVLLTDGKDDSQGMAGLVQKIHNENGITIQTVGLGKDSPSYLKDLAEAGGGQYYLTTGRDTLPNLFTPKTPEIKTPILASQTFIPVVKSASAIFVGMQPEDLPALSGYVVTTPKEETQQILVSDLDEPVLSAWNYGLGRSLAFTSDAGQRWAKDWLAWDLFDRFWTQLLYDAIREQNASMLALSFNPNGSQTDFLIDAQSENGKYLNGYPMAVWVSGPDQQNQIVEPVQTAPGLYTGCFVADHQGVYLIRVSGANQQDSTMPVVDSLFGWVKPYSAEYLPVETNGDLLEKISALSQMESRSLDADPARVFDHDLSGGLVSTPLWPWLVSLALLLLPMDITTRRLLIRSKDFREWGKCLKRKWKDIHISQAGEDSAIPASLLSLLDKKRKKDN